MFSLITPKTHDPSYREQLTNQAVVAVYMSGLQPSPPTRYRFMGLRPMLVYAAPLALGAMARFSSFWPTPSLTQSLKLAKPLKVEPQMPVPCQHLLPAHSSRQKQR